MYLLVGLGNPGKKYECTYHNVGFIVLDDIAVTRSFPAFSPKFDSLLSLRTIGNNKIILLKPYSFMNNSGKPLLQVLSFYKISLDNVIVIHDDADLKLNNIKIKKGGGSAGHNGLKSIDSAIGPDYWRLRVGIGRPDNNDDLANYVLAEHSNMESIKLLANKIAANIDSLLTDDKLSFVQSLV